MNITRAFISTKRLGVGVTVRWKIALLLVAGMAAMRLSAASSYTGAFASDDDKRLIYFSLTQSGPVTLQTWSYAGGLKRLRGQPFRRAASIPQFLFLTPRETSWPPIVMADAETSPPIAWTYCFAGIPT